MWMDWLFWERVCWISEPRLVFYLWSAARARLGEDNAGFSRLFSAVEPYGLLEVTPKDGYGSVRSDDIGSIL
jgi:hypothetical protein